MIRISKDRALLAGQNDGEGSTPFRVVFGLDPAAVLLHNAGGNGKPQPRSAHVAGTRALDAVEPLEDARNLLGRDAHAVVDDLDHHVIVLSAVFMLAGTSGVGKSECSAIVRGTC